MAFAKAAALEDLWSGEMLACQVRGRTVLLVRIDDAVFAYEDRCAHLGMAMSRGSLEGGVLTCWAHHWQYDARSGKGINPVSACLTAFPVQIESGEIWVDVAPTAQGAMHGHGAS